MLYQISHQTSYTYSQSVSLNPHLVRLRPRSDSWQRLHDFSSLVNPQPQGYSELIDLDGNNLAKVWFERPTKQLTLQVFAKVETLQTNPFNYLVEPWATTIPFDYPSSLLKQLKAYLQPYSLTPDASVLELARDLAHETRGDTLSFLAKLNQKIYATCDYIARETGQPWPAGVTWKKQQGSCRDFAVLLMDICRAVGLGTRFVSGYQEGDLDRDDGDLHAWVEVYLPGAGWRGYDPTHGLAVSDRHIAVAASALPKYTAPVSGTVNPATGLGGDRLSLSSTLQTQILISRL